MSTTELNNTEITENDQNNGFDENISPSQEEAHYSQDIELDPQSTYIEATGFTNYEEDENETSFETDDEFVKMVINSGKRRTPTQLNKTSQSIDKKLEVACKSKNAFYAVCQKIDQKVQEEYQNKVFNNADILKQNQEIVEKEYETQNDQPNGEWIIDVENANSNDLAREIERLKTKIQKVQNENKNLEKKKVKLQNEVCIALADNEKLEAQLQDNNF